MELALVSCNFLKKIKSISQHQIAFPINTPKPQIHIYAVAYTWNWVWWGRNRGLVGKENLTGHLQGILRWLVFLFQPFPSLPYFLLTYFPVSHPLPLAGKFRWALFAGRWSFIHLKFTWLFTWFFLLTEGTPTERVLGAVTPIVHTGPIQHPSAFSHCTATLKINNALIQITKILKLSLTEILKFVLFAFSTSVTATLHKHVIFAFNVLIKRKCKAYTCLNHEINTLFSVWHLKARKYQNQVSPISSVYGRNVWRWFKGYLQA